MAVRVGTEITVFKFLETGLVALCEEVAAFVRSGDAERLGVDLSTATYRQDQDGHKVVFQRAGQENSDG